MSTLPELLVVVRLGSMPDITRARLESLGFVVVQVNDPADVRLLRPSGEIEAGPLLRCALAALAGGSFAGEQRENFVRLLAATMKENKP
jgi:hypothetical protein